MKKPTKSLPEIIRIFKHCTNGSGDCGECPYKRTAYTCNIKQLDGEVVEWLERLQKENVELKKQVVTANAEIERLKTK